MRNSPLGLRWFAPIALAIVAVTAIVLTVCAFLETGIQNQYAKAQAARFVVPTVGVRQVISVIGDSYTSGSDQNTKPTWPAQIADTLDLRLVELGIGGSGYLVSSPTSTDKSTFVDRAKKVDPDSDEVIFFGSRNDGTASADRLYAAAKAAFENAKKAAPHARLIVIGVPWVNSFFPASIKSDNNAIHRAATDESAVWVDPLAGDWFPTGSGLIGTDGVHPTDAGHTKLVKLIEPTVKKYLNSPG